MPAPTVINLSDTTPAAPAGRVNVHWLGDTNNPRNVSASVALSGALALLSEVPAGALDGTNLTFTLSSAPSVMELFLNGVKQRINTDFNLSGSTIMFTVAPKPTDTDLVAVYVI